MAWGVVSLVCAAGVWALFATLWNPRVPLAEPLVIARAPLQPGEITMVLGGDFAPVDAAVPFIEAAPERYRWPYLPTAGLLRSADVAFANLEAPVTAGGRPFRPWKDYIYRASPEAVGAWSWLGLDVVALANNHAIDYRMAGLLETIDRLDAAGIAHVGAGNGEAAARRPLIFDVGGTRIGLLAYLEHRAAYGLYLRTFATGDSAGCAQLNRADLEEDVRRLRPLVDVLVVSVHWGENYSAVTSTQREYARLLAGLGVDVVAGHHPHVEQPVELMGRTVVLYSLGNYAWGAPGHDDFELGLLARLRITPRSGRQARLLAVELLPLIVQTRLVGYQPQRLAANGMASLDPFLTSSRRLGTPLRVEQRPDGPAVVIDLAR